MLVHATCVARDGAGVLLRGPSGCGKSELALRMLSAGFELVADDQVEIRGDMASAPDRLAGMLEVRGLGVYRIDFVAAVRLALVVASGESSRVPEPESCELTGLPLVRLRFDRVGCADIIRLALDCAQGRVIEIAGPITR